MLCSVSNLALLLAAAALCIQAVTNEADLTEMGEVVSMVGPTNLPENPTKGSFPNVTRALTYIGCLSRVHHSCQFYSTHLQVSRRAELHHPQLKNSCQVR